MWPDQLQADWQAAVVKATRHTDAAHACQVDRDREHVHQVHFERVVRLLADAEGRAGGYRAGDDVHLLKGSLKVLLDQRAHLLRLEIIGVVVAGAEGVGAQHDATLDFWAKTFTARLAE